MMKKLLAVLLTTLGLVSALPHEDKVHKLHQMPDLSFGLYSGYVPINGTSKQLHYIAALSQGDPLKDPVIVWFNGGPGCSSLMGWAQEHGPYVIEDGATEFTKNHYSWNREASVIYVESPAGVGFSLCPVKEECDFNDINSAEDNLIALLNIFTMKFPELQHNDLWLSGESYAGIYVP
jgi:serine carboxypeptidase-like clade 2